MNETLTPAQKAAAARTQNAEKRAEKVAEKAMAREAIRRAMLNVLEGCASPTTKVRAAGLLLELEKDAR